MNTRPQLRVSRLRVPVHPGDHVRGPETSPVTIVWYGDFQCPYSAATYRNLAEVLRQRAGAIRLVFRHFPVVNLHPYAELAARTAEVAAGYGRFWDMHDWLFARQEQLDPVQLSVGAQEIGLPAEEVTGRMAEDRVADRIRQDVVGGVHSGVTATPAFFLNGVRHDDGYGVTQLLAAVDAARDQAAEGAALRGSARGAARDQAGEGTALRPAAHAAVRGHATGRDHAAVRDHATGPAAPGAPSEEA